MSATPAERKATAPQAEKGYSRLNQHLGPGNGHQNGLTPDRARDLACWTVLIALRRGEVLNGRERVQEEFLLPKHGVGRHAGVSRRQRAMEEVL